MKRQPTKSIDKNDPEYIAKKAETETAIIKKTRTDILSMLQKLKLKLIPSNFELEFVDDTEYPKYIKVKNGERIDGLVVHSREEEESHEKQIISDREKRVRAAAKAAAKANKKTAFEAVNDGDGKDSTAGDK